MIQNSYKGFYARMLGGFFLYFGSQELVVPMKLHTKPMQLLLRLIKAGNAGIGRKELVDTFQRGGYDWNRQINNFRQQVWILRHVLQKSGFPEGKYIVLKHSRYYFTLEHEVETDTGGLDRLLPMIHNRTGEENPERMRKLLMEFCRIYTGEFLPMLNGEEWVNLESAYYQNWYFKCLKQLCGILKQEGNYEEMLKLCTAASQIHPYDQWQAIQIDCLMSMNRYKEAMKIYEKTAQMFYEDLGIRVTDPSMSRCPSAWGQFYHAADPLANVMEQLREPGDIRGPYCCSYPSFLDLYRVISRLGEPTGTKNLLLVCTMEGRRPEPMKPDSQEMKSLKETKESDLWEQNDPDMELLQQILEETLAYGDIYTRYSAGQFLALLTGAGQEDGLRIAGRLQERWKELQTGRSAVHVAGYLITGSAAEEEKNEKDAERNLSDTYH